MRFLPRNRILPGVSGVMIIMMLWGCAGVKKVDIGQKYEDSKSWVKEKWQKVEAKFSSPEDEAPPSEEKTPPPEDSAAESRKEYFEHRVRWRGETLSLIAKWYTGRYQNWKALAGANPGLDPDRIVIGDRIRIPPDIMKTKQPLPRKVAAKTLSGYFAHTVTKTDEKLSHIAEWYTGDKDNARTIADANHDIDPELLLVGNEVYIPSALLKTRDPMYQKSIQAKTAKTSRQERKTEAAAQTPPQEKKIQLFGPKPFPAQ